MSLESPALDKARGPLKMISTALSAVSALSIFLLTGLVFISVFFRYVLSSPIRMTEDLMGIFLGFTIFTAFPLVSVSRSHIKVELLTGLTWGWVNKARLVLIDLACLGIIAFLGLRMYDEATKFYRRDVATETMGWPMWWLIACFAGLIGVAFVLLAIRVALDMFAPKKAKDMETGA